MLASARSTESRVGEIGTKLEQDFSESSEIRRQDKVLKQPARLRREA